MRLDQAKLKRKASQATFRSLGHAGGAIRLTARRSIRRRKKPSGPGQPPHTQTGRLKRSIRYEVSGDQVVIGPVNELAGRIWNLHEFGGRTRRRRRRRSRQQARIGGYGPIRVRARGVVTSFARIQLTTAAQVARSQKLIDEETQRRGASRKYPPRPFMGPALEKSRSRLPKFWADSVK